MKKELQHELLSRAKAVVTKYNRMLADKKYSFGDGFRDMGRPIHNLEHSIERAEGRDPHAGKRHRQYEVKVRTGPHRIDREQSEHHESFGMLQISRVQGGRGSTRLFGSHLNYHEHTIQLRVLRAYRSFHLSTEWFSPENALPVVEIEMSAAQFAEAITSMNRGAGTPCTIRSVETETMEDLPDEHVPEHRIIVGDFKEEVEGLVLDLNEQLEELDAILDKRHLNKADRAAIRSIVNRSVKLAEDSAPFMVIAAKASQQLTAGDD